MRSLAVRLCLSGSVAFAIVGCTSESYREQADKQIYQMLAEKKQQTLGYEPQAKAEDVAGKSADPAPTKKSFEILPMSPRPPESMSPMEPMRSVLPFGRTGPSPMESQTPLPTSPGSAATQPSSPSVTYGIVAATRKGKLKLSYAPPGPEEQPTRMDLFSALKYGADHSREYSTAMEELYLQALDVSLQRHLFEPRPFAKGSLLYTGAQSDSKFNTALTATGNVGVKQQLPYGGQIVAQTLVSFVDALHGNVTGGESANVALSASIPLLKGAGMINLEPLIDSERQLIYQVRTFESYRRQFVVSVATQYFNLVASQKSVLNRRVNYTNLLQLTQQTEALYTAGRINFLGVQRALQAQLFAESSLVDAQIQYEQALDSFKLLLGMPVTENLDIAANELDFLHPDLESTDGSKPDPEAMAVKYRLELKTSEDQIEDARRAIANARNGLLPDVQITAQGQVGNRSKTPAVNLDDRTATYSAGISVDLPVDRYAERNNYRQSLIAFERANRSYRAVRDQILIEVRDAVRTINSAETAMAIQRRNTDLAKRRLEYSYELLKLGAADSRDVVESQQSLISAQDGYERALSSLQIAVLKYLRSTGTLRIDPSAGSIGIAMDRK